MMSVDTPSSQPPIGESDVNWMQILHSIKCSFVTLIPVRGGYIIPMQEPGLTTTGSRNPYSLLVALDLNLYNMHFFGYLFG